MASRVYSCTLPRTNIVMWGLANGLEKYRTIWGSLYGPVKSSCGPAPGASRSWFSFHLTPDSPLAPAAAALLPLLCCQARHTHQRRSQRCLGLCGLFPLTAPAMLTPSLPRLCLWRPPLKICHRCFRHSARSCMGRGRLREVNCWLFVACSLLVGRLIGIIAVTLAPPPPFFGLSLWERLLPPCPCLKMLLPLPNLRPPPFFRLCFRLRLCRCHPIVLLPLPLPSPSPCCAIAS